MASGEPQPAAPLLSGCNIQVAGRDRSGELYNFAIRWVKISDALSEPILYYHGKRLTKAWTITLTHTAPDERDSNANTADI